MIEPNTIHIIYSKRRTIALSMAPNGTVIVKAPLRAPKAFVSGFLEKHAGWIEKQRAVLQEHTPLSVKKYVEGEQFLYLGKSCTLRIGEYPGVQVQGDELQFPRFLMFRIRKELEAWYIRQAEIIVTQQVMWVAERMPASYTEIAFADTKSKWGHCTHDNRLQFNWRLIMASLLVINYVVVHELAHTTEKNHSRSFWNTVGRFNPSYRQQIKWLKQYGNTLIV